MALPAYSEPMPAIQFRNNIFTDFLDEWSARRKAAI
jgi:hypothetical protein